MILKLDVPISMNDVGAVLRLLPELQMLRPEDVGKRWPGEVIREDPLTITMYGEYHPLVEEFRASLYKHNLIRDYDWSKLMSRAEEVHDHPERLRRVSMKTCIKLLTLHVRYDRFCDGHLPNMIQDGHMVAILQRMAILKERS